MTYNVPIAFMRIANVLRHCEKRILKYTDFTWDFHYSTAANAPSSAAIRSFTFSVPMDRRIVFGLMP